MMAKRISTVNTVSEELEFVSHCMKNILLKNQSIKLSQI